MIGKSRQERERLALLNEIAAEAEATEQWTGVAAFDPRVMDAMAKVQRREFVPEDEISYAWLNVPLPIGHRQTISQPFIVALMTNLLRPGSDDIIFEVGTGSGYQAAGPDEKTPQRIANALHDAVATT